MKTRITLLFLSLCLISFNNWGQSYKLVKYNKCAIRQVGDSDYSFYDLDTKFKVFDDNGSTIYFYSTENDVEQYDILTEISTNYVENYKYYEFIAMNSSLRLFTVRFFPDSVENGIYFVFDDGTNVQFYYEN